MEDTKNIDNYPLEIFFSTDGKHTVSIKSTVKYRDLAMKVGQEMYDQLESKYGKKPTNNGAARSNGVSEPKKATVDQENCGHAMFSMKESSGHNNPENKGKRYKVCLDCDKWLGWV